MRIISRASYPNPRSADTAIARLAAAQASDRHDYWTCDVSLLDEAVIDRARLHGPRQVTDAYLLALAVAHDGRLVTFDRKVATSAVVGAQERHLALI